MLANIAAALPFYFFVEKEKMELSREFDKIDAMLTIKYVMLFAEQERK